MDQLLVGGYGAATESEPSKLAAAQERRWFESVWLMIAVALIVRLIVMRFAYLNLLDPAWDHYLAGWDGGQLSFAREYERIAKSIVTGQGFSSPYPISTGPTALVGPAYAYLLAAVFKVFGVLTSASTLAALAINDLMSSLLCLPVYLIARRSFGPKIAVLSGWAWALYPHSIAGSNAWLWDTILGTLLLTFLIFSTLRLERSTSYAAWLGYGLLWVIATLTNANVLSTLPFFGAWILLRQWKTRRLRVGPMIASALVLLIGVTPWVWRCSELYGRFVAFRGNFGLEVMVGNSTDTSRPSNWNETPGSNLAELQKFQRLGEAAYMAEKQTEATNLIKERPLWFAGQTLRRILYTWTNIWSFPPRWTYDEIGLPNALIYTLVSVLAFIGLGWAIRNRWEETVPLLIPLCFFPIVYYITHQDDGRFRHPIDPVVVIFAACGIYSVWSRRRKNLDRGAGSDGPVDESASIPRAESIVR